MKMKFQATERLAGILIVVGLVVTLFFFLLLLIYRHWETGQPIDASLFSNAGEFIGGVAGSLWALAGIILVFVALREQKKSSAKLQRTQDRTLRAQNETLKAQLEELALQREESVATRDVFIEQSRTMRKQQFENTFFKVFEVWKQNVGSSKVTTEVKYPSGNRVSHQGHGLDTFNALVGDLRDFYKSKLIPIINKNLEAYSFDSKEYIHFAENEKHGLDVPSIVSERMELYKDKVENVIATILFLLKYIDASGVDNASDYYNFMRSQFSGKQQAFIFYLGLSSLGKDLKPIIERYGLMEGLRPDHLIIPSHKTMFYDNTAFGR